MAPGSDWSPMLPAGKLPADLLATMLARLQAAGSDASLLLGPRPGEDAAAVRIGDRALVVASDPITFATRNLGWHAVHVNANDVAACGAEPRWFVATILLPEGAAPDLPLAIVDEMIAACAEVGAALIGGHTEITGGLPRPLVAGTMLGETRPERLLPTGGAQPGDALTLAGGIAIEGTALIAAEFADRVDARFGAAFGERCRAFLRRPGISVLPAARAALLPGVHALHDPTEGGLATALREMAGAAGVGLRVRAEAIPIYPETRALCDHFSLDPLGLLASGALLIAVAPGALPALVTSLAAAGIDHAVIGEALPASAGLALERDGRTVDLPAFARDEVARLFDEIPEKG